MTVTIAALIGAAVGVIGTIISVLTFGVSKCKDSEEDGERNGGLMVEIGYIRGGIDDIKTQQRSHDEKFLDLYTHISRVDESAKSAHKRIDRMEEKINHE